MATRRKRVALVTQVYGSKVKAARRASRERKSSKVSGARVIDTGKSAPKGTRYRVAVRYN